MSAVPRLSSPSTGHESRAAKLRRSLDAPVVDRAVPALTDEFTAWLITGLAARLSRGASSYYSQTWGIGTTEYRLVMALGREGPCTAIKAASAADMDKAAASRSMQVLVRAGFIEMTRLGRVVNCSLTPPGRELEAALHDASMLRDRRLTHGFEPDELQRLRSDLRRLIDNLSYMNEE